MTNVPLSTTVTPKREQPNSLRQHSRCRPYISAIARRVNPTGSHEASDCLGLRLSNRTARKTPNFLPFDTHSLRFAMNAPHQPCHTLPGPDLHSRLDTASTACSSSWSPDTPGQLAFNSCRMPRRCRAEGRFDFQSQAQWRLHLISSIELSTAKQAAHQWAVSGNTDRQRPTPPRPGLLQFGHRLRNAALVTRKHDLPRTVSFATCAPRCLSQPPPHRSEQPPLIQTEHSQPCAGCLAPASFIRRPRSATRRTRRQNRSQPARQSRVLAHRMTRE